MSKQKFEHDHCPRCRFIGHWFDHDVWICGSEGEESIIARYGNNPWDYASSPIRVVFGDSKFEPDHRIGLLDGSSMPYIEWLFGERDKSPSTKAMVIGILVEYQKLSKQYKHLQKKVEHGCIDSYCISCDKKDGSNDC